MLIVAMVVGGCGEKPAPSPRDEPARASDDRSAPSPGDDRVPSAGEARATVKRYFAAIARGDGAAMCHELSPEARETAASLGHLASCEEAGRLLAKAPPEVMQSLTRGRYGRAKVNGDKATVRVTDDGAYRREKAEITVPLVVHDDRWVIERLVDPGAAKTDPVLTCVVGAIDAFEKGLVDDFWKQEGRADWVAFMAEVCKRIDAAGVFGQNSAGSPSDLADLSPEDRKAVQRIFAEVANEMVRSGRIERP